MKNEQRVAQGHGAMSPEEQQDIAIEELDDASPVELNDGEESKNEPQETMNIDQKME